MNPFRRFKRAWSAMEAHIEDAEWDLLEGDSAEALAYQQQGHALADAVRDAELAIFEAAGGKLLTDGTVSDDDDDIDDATVIDYLCW